MLSEFELAQLAAPGKADVALVDEMVRTTLADLSLAPPISHDIVASYRGVEHIEVADIPWAGHIALTDDGLVIAVREGDSWKRQRFTIFHEIMHTYMRGFRLQPQYRCHPGEEPAGASCDPALERLCDRGAAELLIPTTALLADLAGNTVNLDLVDELAEAYEASRTATASRICSINPAKTWFLTLELAAKPRDPLGNPKLRVQSCVSGANQRYIPKHKSAALGGVFDRALHGELVDEAIYLDELTTQPLGRVHVSARRSDFVDEKGLVHERVRALITETTLGASS